MKKLGIAVLLLFISSFAVAEDLYCEGNLEHIQIYDFHGVYINGTWNTGQQRICDLDGGWKGVPAVVCKVWVSTLQTALYTGAPVRIRYDDADTAITDCANLPNNSEGPTPFSIILLK